MEQVSSTQTQGQDSATQGETQKVLDITPDIWHTNTMNITELKRKIREFEKALDANESGERVNLVLKEGLQES